MTDLLTLESFAPHVDTEFVARVGEAEDRLTLVEASLLSRQYPDAPRPGCRRTWPRKDSCPSAG